LALKKTKSIIDSWFVAPKKIALNKMYLVTSNGDENVPFWHFESCAEHSLDVGLVVIFSKACHFSSTGHFYPQLNISSSEP
jgi:hypothetical protein